MEKVQMQLTVRVEVVEVVEVTYISTIAVVYHQYILPRLFLG